MGDKHTPQPTKKGYLNHLLLNQTIVCHNHVNNENYKTNEAMEGKSQSFSVLKTQSRLVIRSNSQRLLLWHQYILFAFLFPLENYLNKNP